MTQVDHGLTNVAGLTQLIQSLALMTLIKNLGRHNNPLPRRSHDGSWSDVAGSL
jgi:hypothetical protein